MDYRSLAEMRARKDFKARLARIYHNSFTAARLDGTSLDAAAEAAWAARERARLAQTQEPS